MSSRRDSSELRIDPETLLDVVAAADGDVIMAIDDASTVLFVNAAAERVFGYEPGALLGEPVARLIPGFRERVHEPPTGRDDAPRGRSVASRAVELTGVHRDGHEVPVEVSFAESLSGGRRVILGVVRDVTHRKDIERELHARTLHDALTGLPNRALLVDRLERVLRRRRDDATHDAALLFLDFDRFKLVNDSLGHAVGDTMLIEIGAALSHVVRSEDTVARLGGDEFVILLDHVDAQARPVELAERIQRAFREPVQVHEYEIYTSASIGIVPSLFRYRDSDAVLRDADTAMYRAKARGPGHHQVFDQDMRRRAVAAMDVENDLRRAMDRNEFRVRYEPIHCAGSGELWGFEALTYWLHPKRGLLPPAAFLQSATELGILRDIEHWVWREAGRNVAAWRRRFGRALTLSLNFSPRHLLVSEGERPLLEALEEVGADVDQTIIELHEFALSEASEDRLELLKRLSELGVGIHLDNFGTDHASLYHLQRFRIDALKIDRSIVTELMHDAKSEKLATVICGLAENLSLEVVAKGVEDEAQRAYLGSLHCDYVQGRFFAPPLSDEEAARYVEAHLAPSSDSAGARE